MQAPGRPVACCARGATVSLHQQLLYPHANGNGLFLPDQSAAQYGLPGFGGPQGIFVIEAAIHKAAETIGVPATVIQQKNLSTGQQFPIWPGGGQ